MGIDEYESIVFAQLFFVMDSKSINVSCLVHIMLVVAIATTIIRYYYKNFDRRMGELIDY